MLAGDESGSEEVGGFGEVVLGEGGFAVVNEDGRVICEQFKVGGFAADRQKVDGFSELLLDLEVSALISEEVGVVLPYDNILRAEFNGLSETVLYFSGLLIAALSSDSHQQMPHRMFGIP